MADFVILDLSLVFNGGDGSFVLILLFITLPFLSGGFCRRHCDRVSNISLLQDIYNWMTSCFSKHPTRFLVFSKSLIPSN